MPPTPPSFPAKPAVACLAQNRKRVSSGVVDLVIEKLHPKKKKIRARERVLRAAERLGR